MALFRKLKLVEVRKLSQSVNISKPTSSMLHGCYLPAFRTAKEFVSTC